MTDHDIQMALDAVHHAHAALTSAVAIVEHKQTELSGRLTVAKTVLGTAVAAAGELEAITKDPAIDSSALRSKVAVANEKSAGALKSSADLIGAVGFVGVVGSPIDEWKECRSTIDRFDKMLVDLRKTGFGFVTAIAAGAQFIFTDANYFAAKAALLAMLIVLIITLYSIDLVHQLWLDVAVERAKTIERDRFSGSISLTTEIGTKYKPFRAGALGLILYAMLLLATCSVFFFSVPKSEPLTSGHHGFVVAAFFSGILIMIGAWIWSDDRRRSRPTIFGRRAKSAFMLIVALIVIVLFGGRFFIVREECRSA